MKAQKAIIPFHINEHNRIILHYSLNNHKVNLSFDSAIPFNILDTDLARNINFAKPNTTKVDSIDTVAHVSIGVLIYSGLQSTMQDSIFRGPWMNSDMRTTAKRLEIGEGVDGIVGYNNDYTIELDFMKNRMLVWNSLPKEYSNDGKLYKNNVSSI